MAPGLPPSSALGFGCGAVGGRVGRKQSAWALSAALNAGITHFDVARSYGYGDAESLLGEALVGRRERVVIATKLGITASSVARILKSLKPLAQKAVSSFPEFRPQVSAALRPRARDIRRFSPAVARASLDDSLRALKTDYVDILFLHECSPSDLNDEMLDYLLAEREAGRIRAYGAASEVADVAALAVVHGSRMFYQFPNAITNRNLDLGAAAVRPRITHSPFAGADGVVKLFTDRVEVTPSGRPVGPGDAHHLMLAYALRANAEGVVICSMLSEKHLKENLAVIERPCFPDEDVAHLADLTMATRRSAIILR